MAFIRPPIVIGEDDWSHTSVNAHFEKEIEGHEMQRDALMDQNKLIDVIACKRTCKPDVTFDQDFALDVAGC